MAIKRSYEDGCAAAHALDLVGERWALLIVRELLLGPKRFTDIRAGLPTISPNVLSQRLTELEASGILQQRKLPPPTSIRVYELTPWGAELEPLVLSLARWGVRSPTFRRGAALGADALILSFKAMFAPAAALKQRVTIELRVAEAPFFAIVDRGKLDVGRGPASAPDAVLSADPATVLSLAYGKADLDLMATSGQAEYLGDKTALLRFFSCFALPAPAGSD
ncbi:MAG: transcriptional regulator [Candidimonas sp.]|nr:transcriptional regulator [Candidimonas sp.]